MSSSGPGPGAAADHDGLPTPRRYWALLAFFTALFMAVLDGALANVALPLMARGLDASPAAAIWIVNAYQLAIIMLLLPAAAIGEKAGYRRVYVAGLAIFTAGALVCALSQSLAQLLAARVLQGVGAACLMSNNAAMVRFIYPSRLLGRGIGLNALVISAGAAAGPSVASVILSVASWRWLFAPHVVLGVLAAVLGARLLPRVEGTGRRFDWVAALLSTAMFGFLMLGAESLARTGSLLALAGLAAGLGAGAILFLRERRAAVPLLPLDLFRIPIFRLSIMTSTAAFAAQTLAFVALPFHFQETMGRSVLATGLLMTAWPLATCVTGPVAGRLGDRYPAGALCGAGLAVLAAGLFLLSRVGPGSSDLDIVWPMALCGGGFGFFQAPNSRTLISSAPLARTGAAGGALAMARLSGQLIGAGATGALFHLLRVQAAPLALTAASAAAAASAVFSLLRLRVAHGPPAPGADRIAETSDG